MNPKRLWFIFLFLFFCSLALASQLTYYFSPGCKGCIKIERELYRKFSKNQIIIKDISRSEHMNELLALVKHKGFVSIESPVVYYKDQLIAGEKNIYKFLAADKIVKKTSLTNPFVFSSLVAAALLDGINPCAFAVILFFISYLIFLKKEAKVFLKLGLSFITGVFVCYFLLGFGLFRFLYELSYYQYFSLFFEKTLGVLAIILGIFSFKDYLIYRKTGKSSDMLIQLPASFKKLIHKIIREVLK